MQREGGRTWLKEKRVGKKTVGSLNSGHYISKRHILKKKKLFRLAGRSLNEKAVWAVDAA